MKWRGRGRDSAEALRFDALVRPHLERLYRLAYRFTRSPDDAEDLVQDLLVKMIPRTDHIARLDLPGPWLARALYHLFVDQTRQQQRRANGLGVPLDDPSALDSLLDTEGEAPDDATERTRRAAALTEALATLSREHQAVIAWHDIEGYTLDELANEHDLPIGTLKSRLHRARAHLRVLLAPRE
ncbi:MAG: RNA polymerase sigma factor, partial [Gammaproteobacteria bacterium]